MSTFNLLGAATKDDIKVGYIDPTLGYVTGIGVCQANEYAKKNPGTVFIFKNGNGDLKYLRINEVNRLTPKDIVSTASTCGGVKKRSECGPPTVSFYGGGGVGAKANPIVGTDGAILAVDIVASGFAFQYPPITQVDDFCYNGNGAVMTAILGDTPEKIQTYENEADFEEYELCDISDEDYGNLYDKNGKAVGKWNPKIYSTSPDEDPIQKEIEKYQKFLKELKTPFWDTRKKQPLKISAGGKNYSTAYSVSHPCNNERVRLISDGSSQPSATSEKVEVEFQVKREGGDPTKYLEFIFSSSDGKDRFVLTSGDENKKTYNIKQNVLKNVKYTVESRITDLDKAQPRTTLEKGLSDKKNKEVGKDETGNRIFTDFLGSDNDNDDLRVTLPRGAGKFIAGNKTKVSDGDKTRNTYELFYIFEGQAGKPAGPTNKNSTSQKTKSSESTAYRPTEAANPNKTWGDFMNKYAVSPVDKSNVPGSDNAGTLFTMEWQEEFPYDGEYIFRGLADNKAKLYLDNQFVEDLKSFADSPKAITKTVNAGVHNIRVDLLNVPIYENVITQSSSQNGNVDIQSKNVFNTVDYISKANRTLWRINPSASTNDSLIHRLGIAPFDTTVQLEDNPYAGVHTIIWENINFPVDGNYRINIAVDDNVKLFIGNAATGGGDEVVIDHKGFPANSSRALPNYSDTKFFKKGKYRILAELEQIPGGKFGFSSIKGINPMALAIDITTDFIEKTVVSSKSWCENPMGVALTIEAPAPPIPQETPPPQDGPCPPNPIWSSRFPNGSSKWYPVRYDRRGKNVTASTSTKTQNESVRPKFIKDKKDGKYYLDLREYKGEVNLDMEFLIKDTKKGGGGFAGTAFEIGGTNVKFDRSKQSGKALTDAVRSKSFKVAGGKLYGPIKFLGADSGSSVDLRNPYQIRSLDKKSTKDLRDGDLKDNIDFNVIIKGATVQSTSTVTKSSTSKTWSKFMNRYAVSPVLPLNVPGSDQAGVQYSNTWNVNVPSRGFYGVQVLADNKGRILIDGNEIAKSEGFNTENPKVTKVLLESGSHTITTEVINTAQFRTFVEREKIFSTQDWRNFGDASNKTVNVDFSISVSGSFANKFEIKDLGISVSKEYNGPSKQEKITKSVEVGRIYTVNLSTSPSGSIKLRTAGDNVLQVEDHKDFNWRDMECSTSTGKFYNLNGSTCNFIIEAEPKPYIKNGIVYNGPLLFSHKQTTGGPNGKGWSDFMNKYSVSPKVFNKIDEPDEKINGTFILNWENVPFPETGDYSLKFQADNIAILKIDGVEVFKTTDFASEPTDKVVNVNAGKHNITIDLTNVKDRTDIFLNNPMGVSLFIDKVVTKRSQNNISWNQNPMGISAILIPPPCAKKINGRGVIEKVIVEEPGNGYLQPSPQAETYPVLLRLTEVVVINPGINYNCGVDVIKVVPDNGTKLSYSCESFGRITNVKVEVPGEGFTSYPRIIVETPDFDPEGRPLQPTGVNFEAVPVFEVVRDPIEVEPERLIQVTDLAGLKQTGYVDGRAYYGAVFYEDGARYAGYYRTPGQLIRVYDTLQESITGRVTTAPNAIERSGTDITSNDPRLNIPGTPGNPQQ